MSAQRLRPQRSDFGTIRVGNAVIGRIAAIAAREVPGVAEVREGTWPWRGVRVEATEPEVTIRLEIVVEYGVHIPRVTVQVQERVRAAVHRMTELGTVVVDVGVCGVQESKEGS